jgi:hypothetical protein
MEEGISEESEPSEEELAERTGPTQAEVDNSILRAFINIGCHEQQGSHDD